MKRKRNKLKGHIELYGFSEKEKIKVYKAFDKMLNALSSREFYDFCRFGVPVGRIRRTGGRNGKQFYDHIMSGAETLAPEVDNCADVFLCLDKRYIEGVIGYTYPNSQWQYIYNWFFRDGSIDDVAGNLGHEWMHKLGYEHSYNYHPNRQFSGPYAVGYFVRDYK